jgi:hypothetical protein
MTGKTRRDALRRLADELAEDILRATVAELRAEAAEDQEDPAKIAAAMRAIFERADTESRKSKLAAARAAIDADRQKPSTLLRLDPALARRRLAAALESDPETMRKLTLAARKGEKLSDEDVLAILEDLQELGIFPRSDDEDRKP